MTFLWWWKMTRREEEQSANEMEDRCWYFWAALVRRGGKYPLALRVGLPLLGE